MARAETSLKSNFTREPLKEKRETKETLLEALHSVEDEIKALGHDILSKRLETLREQVKRVVENEDEEIKCLYGQIQSLKDGVDKLKVKHKKLENELVLAQATWVWEAHVAKFVVDPSKEIHRIGWFRQMERHLKKLKNPTHNRWTELKSKLTDWTDEQQEIAQTSRDEINSTAHSDVIDLDLVASEIEIRMSPESQKLMKDMLDMLKMTASLMKFGRLAKFYDMNMEKW